MKGSFTNIKRNKFIDNGWFIQISNMHFYMFRPIDSLLVKSGNEAEK